MTHRRPLPNIDGVLGAHGTAWITTASLALALVSDCGTEPLYPPLVCDPDAAGEMVFGYQRGGAYFPRMGAEANGSEFLFVDGACRYWTGYAQVITGTLGGDELAAINAELMTGAWPTIDGYHQPGCCDGETIGLARDGIRASLYDFGGGNETFLDLSRIAARWSDRLATTGSRVPPDAPLRLEMVRTRPSGTATAWPLDEPLSAIAGPTEGQITVHVFEGADAATLRALEPRTLTDGSIYVSALVVDIVPFANDEGCLRPLFAGDCRIFNRY